MKIDKNRIKDLSFLKECYSKTKMDCFLTHYLENNMKDIVNYFNRYSISDYGELPKGVAPMPIPFSSDVGDKVEVYKNVKNYAITTIGKTQIYVCDTGIPMPTYVCDKSLVYGGPIALKKLKEEKNLVCADALDYFITSMNSLIHLTFYSYSLPLILSDNPTKEESDVKCEYLKNSLVELIEPNMTINSFINAALATDNACSVVKQIEMRYTK